MVWVRAIDAMVAEPRLVMHSLLYCRCTTRVTLQQT
jgi:hypothetical protein